jgi:hypothetical protein
MAHGSLSAPRVWSISGSIQGKDDTNPAVNIYVVGNTLVGQRFNFQENSGGSIAAQRSGALLINNLADQINCKDDIKYIPNGARTGNWNVMYGVGASGNTDLDPNEMDTAWDWEFFGLNSYANKHWAGQGTDAPWAVWPRFINRQSGVLDGILRPGNGDYHLRSDSPLFQLECQWVLPYDLDGFERGLMDPPGAYSSGNAKKGGFF